jgi:hypothetical protein
MAWTLLSAAAKGDPPAGRSGHGFTSAEGKLYVHGGSGAFGNLNGSLWVHIALSSFWKRRHTVNVQSEKQRF